MVLKDRQFVVVDQNQKGRSAAAAKKAKQKQSKQMDKSSASDLMSKSRGASIASSIAKTTPFDSLDNTMNKAVSTTPSVTKLDDQAKDQHYKNEQLEIQEVKELLATKSDEELNKSMLKNAEFNRDLRRNYNRYKREMLKQQQLQSQLKQSDQTPNVHSVQYSNRNAAENDQLFRMMSDSLIFKTDVGLEGKKEAKDFSEK